MLTLTPGAADEIAERYGRTAIVVAHPSVATPVPDLGGERGLVGLVLRCPSPALPDPAGLVAPSCRWFTDQWSDVVTYGNDEERGFDPVSLAVAVGAALARPMPRPADRGWRGEQRAAVRRVHEQVYASVAADRAPA